MSPKHQRALLFVGAAIVVAAFVLAVISSTLVWNAGMLDFWPGVLCVGLTLVIVAGIARMKDKSEASLVAFIIRILNTGFVLFSAFAIFLWLPINNRVAADLLSVTVANGVVLTLAVSYWWFVHRELRLASPKKRPNQSAQPMPGSVTPRAIE